MPSYTPYCYFTEFYNNQNFYSGGVIRLDVWKIILIAAAVGVAFGIIGFILGGLHRKRVAEAAIGSATKEANRIVSEAMTQAEAKKKEAILEAKDEIHKQRSEN